MDYNLGPYRPEPKGEFNPEEEYYYLDIVSYNQCAYINCNLNNVRGVSCIGVPPTGHTLSSTNWMQISWPGPQGERPDIYQAYGYVTNGIWDFSTTDKIFIPDTGLTDTIEIQNVYDGACGAIITHKELILPSNSMKSSDYNFVEITSADEYYFYTFSYCGLGTDEYYFIWHRSIVSKS